MQIKNLLASSKDPAKISLTVKGLAILVPSAVMLFGFLGVDISALDLNELVDSLANAAFAIATAFSAVTVVIGSARKIYYRVYPK